MARPQMRKGTDASPGPGVFSVLSFWEQRPLVFLALCAVLGVAAGREAPLLPALYSAGILSGTLLFIALYRLKKPALPALMLIFFFLFTGLSGVKSHPVLPIEGDYTVSALVADAPDVREDDHVRVYLKDVALLDAAGKEWTQSGAYWTYYLKDGLTLIPEAGQKVTFSASLYHPGGQRNPCGYDARTALLAKGVGIGLYGAEGLTAGRAAADIRTVFFLARQKIAERLDLLFGVNSALPKALLLGLKEDLPEDTRDAFAKAGIAHVLAVSGLHVGLIAAFLALVTRRFLSPRARAYVLSAFLFGYCLMLDFAPGVFRASVLTGTLLFSRARGRLSDPLSALSFAALAVLAFRPLDLFTYGFILSFSAALGLTLLRTPFERVFSFIRLRRARRDLATTFAATTGTLVPASFAFHRFSALGLIASPAVCAVIAVLIPAYLLLLLLSAASLQAAMLVAPALSWATGALEQACLWLGQLPFASFRVPDMPWPLIPFCLAAPWLVSPYCAMRTGKRRAFVLLCLFLLGAGVHAAVIDHGITYTQLSVGNADCAVLFDDRETVVIDTGDRATELTRYLLAVGRDIDTLVLTHLHSDHAAGVADILKEDIRIGRVLLPADAEKTNAGEDCLALLAALKARGVPVFYLSSGDAFSTRRAEFTARWPAAGSVRPGMEANDRALALRLCAEGVSFYLASDVSGVYDRYAAQKSDVLKVSHHGGSNETTEDFLSVVQPRVAVISTSDRSDRSATTKRLRAASADTYSTADGAVVIHISGGKINVRSPYQTTAEER